MKKFKPLKELIKALTYIGDAIAGTNKSSSSQGESNDIYDGILEVANGRSKTYFSFGIKDNNNNATKLGDLFTDNFINDLNSNDNIDIVSTVTDLLDTKIELRAGPSDRGIHISLIYKDGSAIFVDDGTNFDISIVDSTGRIKAEYQITSSKPFTKDTPLQTIQDA